MGSFRREDYPYPEEMYGEVPENPLLQSLRGNGFGDRAPMPWGVATPVPAPPQCDPAERLRYEMSGRGYMCGAPEVRELRPSEWHDTSYLGRNRLSHAHARLDYTPASRAPMATASSAMGVHAPGFGVAQPGSAAAQPGGVAGFGSASSAAPGDVNWLLMLGVAVLAVLIVANTVLLTVLLRLLGPSMARGAPAAAAGITSAAPAAAE